MLEKYQSLCENNQQIIVSRDPKSKNPVVHVANNRFRNSVMQYRLDNKSILGGNTSCCDYLVLNCEKKRAFFIELKGRQVLKAKEQIERAEALVGNDLPEFIRCYRIIYKGRTHDVQSSTIVNWKKKAGACEGVPVVLVKNGKCEEQIDF